MRPNRLLVSLSNAIATLCERLADFFEWQGYRYRRCPSCGEVTFYSTKPCRSRPTQ